MKDNTETLTQLGNQNTKYIYEKPSARLLETFENLYPGREYVTEFVFNEFTSLCLHGDTLIDVATDETISPEGIPIRDLVGKTGVVFSFDINENKPVARNFHSVRKTGNKPVLCVKFSLLKGASNARHWVEKQIVCSYEHPFLVRVGWGRYEWIAAQDLKPNMQLVADQRSIDVIRGLSRHRLILENKLGRLLQNEEIAHHEDFNHYNNAPDNIEIVVSNAAHISLHQKARCGIEIDEQELVDAYNAGENFNTLAKKYSVDVSTIYSRIGHLVEKRTQSESLRLTNNSIELDAKKEECRQFYEKGYTVNELSLYYDRHETTISNWVLAAGGCLRTAAETKDLRKEKELPALNHRIVSIEPIGNADVYNMEVEDTECFFANGVVVHNCPKTGQPDFATITVRYAPAKLCIETKSLKLYFLSYRQHGAFMESITNRMLEDCVSVCNPRWMEVKSNFNTRGGTLINVEARYDESD